LSGLLLRANHVSNPDTLATLVARPQIRKTVLDDI